MRKAGLIKYPMAFLFCCHILQILKLEWRHRLARKRGPLPLRDGEDSWPMGGQRPTYGPHQTTPPSLPGRPEGAERHQPS